MGVDGRYVGELGVDYRVYADAVYETLGHDEFAERIQFDFISVTVA